MGRSAKEACRPGQAVDGGGKVRPSATKIEVKGATSSGMARAQAKQKQRGGAAPEQPKETKQDPSDYKDKSGWEKVGQAGADIIKTRAARKAAE